MSWAVVHSRFRLEELTFKASICPSLPGTGGMESFDAVDEGDEDGEGEVDEDAEGDGVGDIALLFVGDGLRELDARGVGLSTAEGVTKGVAEESLGSFDAPDD